MEERTLNLLEISQLNSEELLGNFKIESISFSQKNMEKVALIGETGSGKSTLLKIIAGLIQPQDGSIFFNGNKVKGPDWQLIPGEKGIAYLSQHFELRNNYRMEELLAFGNEFTQNEAEELYKLCRIDHLLKRNSYELSGGEKQRIALAKLLLTKPTLLILDEPYSNLDLIHRTILKEVVNDICEKYKISCILTSHEPADVLPWADKILVLKNGKLIQEGSPLQVYKKPINEYVAALLGSYNLLDQSIFGEKLLLRPENILITDNLSEKFTGTVTANNFLGSYYEIDIQIKTQIIKVKTTNGKLNVGDKVGIYF